MRAPAACMTSELRTPPQLHVELDKHCARHARRTAAAPGGGAGGAAARAPYAMLSGSDVSRPCVRPMIVLFQMSRPSMRVTPSMTCIHKSPLNLRSPRSKP